jgi:transposase InsO family protein
LLTLLTSDCANHFSTRQSFWMLIPGGLLAGLALDDTLEAKLAIKALRRALADRPVPASLVHHSDRGVQYCSGEYVEILRSHGIRISMSRSGNPYDNALAERFMRTLKCEEVYLNDYRIERTPRVTSGTFLSRCRAALKSDLPHFRCRLEGENLTSSIP